jgi:hypothetical protein
MRLSKYCVCATVLLLLAYPSTTWAYPSDPNNAALLYYQAFISFPDNFNEISMPLDPSPSGIIEPNQAVRDYLEGCNNALEFTKAAAKIRKCDWGLRYSLGDRVLMPHSMLIRQLSIHVMAQAQVYAADREYHKALENCLILHKIAQHVGDEDFIAFLISNAIHGLANKGVRQTLSLMPPNEKTLVWLEQELKMTSQRPRLNHALVTEEQITLRKLALDKDSLIEMAKTYSGGSLDPRRKELLNKADPAFLQDSREYYVQSMAALRKALEEKTPFETKYERIKRLDDQLASIAKTNPHAVFTAIFRAEWARTYAVCIFSQSGDNSLGAALHLYKVKSQTGALPKKLPAGLPKNPFNGKDFAYERTEDGFILGVETKGLGRDKPRKLTFKVK